MLNDETRDKAVQARRQTQEINLEAVKRLQIRGITRTNEIQLHLEKMGIKVTERTVWRYKRKLKKRHERAVREKIGLSKSVEDLALTLKNTFEEVTREFWKIYHDKESSAQAKVSALKNIKDTSKESVEIMQTMGLVHREADKVQQIGADGKPIDPTINVNLQQINNEFTAFLMSKFTDPVGSTGDHHVIDRGK